MRRFEPLRNTIAAVSIAAGAVRDPRGGPNKKKAATHAAFFVRPTAQLGLRVTLSQLVPASPRCFRRGCLLEGRKKKGEKWDALRQQCPIRSVRKVFLGFCCFFFLLQ